MMRYYPVRAKTWWKALRFEAKVFLAIISIMLLVNVLLAFGELRFQQTTADFHTLQNGLCTLLDKSNKDIAKNKILLTGQAQRARLRYKIDKAAGNVTAAQSDLDAAQLYERFVKQSKPINTKPFGC